MRYKQIIELLIISIFSKNVFGNDVMENEQGKPNRIDLNMHKILKKKP